MPKYSSWFSLQAQISQRDYGDCFFFQYLRILAFIY